MHKRQIAVIIAILAMLLVVTASASAQATGQAFHTVVRGETLNSISRLYGVSVQAISAANGISNPNRIYVGQVLRIPSPSQPAPPTPPPPSSTTSYVVRPGDTLARIAATYGTTVQAISAANNITNPNRIYVGQVLVIPRQPVIFTYVVQQGDNLTRIALRFGTTVNAILSYNNIQHPSLIFPGQVLLIPVYS